LPRIKRYPPIVKNAYAPSDGISRSCDGAFDKATAAPKSATNSMPTKMQIRPFTLILRAVAVVGGEKDSLTASSDC